MVSGEHKWRKAAPRRRLSTLHTLCRIPQVKTRNIVGGSGGRLQERNPEFAPFTVARIRSSSSQRCQSESIRSALSMSVVAMK